MLEFDPEKRPTALQVLMRLKEPDIPMPPSGTLEIDEPWPKHNIVFNREKIKAANIAILKRSSVGRTEEYEVITRAGKKSTLSKDEVLTKGWATAKRTNVFDEPWTEHNIEFDLSKIKSKGYVSIERQEVKGVKLYYFYKENGSYVSLTLQKLMIFEFAHKKRASRV